MSELLDEVRVLKDEALSLRKQGRPDKAVAVLNVAIAKLTKVTDGNDFMIPTWTALQAAAGLAAVLTGGVAAVALTGGVAAVAGAFFIANSIKDRMNSESGSRLAKHLDPEICKEFAECFGMIGGAERAANKLPEAIEAYDTGYKFETRLPTNVIVTYNRLNRLVVRVLLNPSLLDAKTGSPENERSNGLDVRAELRKLEDELSRQTQGHRRNDRWAFADLAVIRTLIGDADGAVAALIAFEEKLPDRHALESTLAVLHALAKVELPKDQRQAVRMAITRLERLINTRWN
jgi:hypothetical protein